MRAKVSKKIAKARPNAAAAENRAYVPTERERAAMKKIALAQKAKPVPRLKVVSTEKAEQLSLDHPNYLAGNALLMDALGTHSTDFVNGLLEQLARTGAQDG